jgi:hypothetical protein
MKIHPKRVENFQKVLSELESEFFEKKEKQLLKASIRLGKVSVIIMCLVILIFVFEWPPCLFSGFEVSQYHFWQVSSLIGFLVALTFYALGQYNKVANLRIDARNRLAMAKLLA